MDKELLKDIINWDVVNWSKSINYWERHVDFTTIRLGLELGAREGGLSLWLALKGCKMICSDLESPEKQAFEVHKKYPCKSLIEYSAIDATSIPYKNRFDVVVFKSILGGIGRNDSTNLKQQTINEIYKALKEDGVLLFSENIEGSFIHKFLRKKFSDWGYYWNYLKYEDVDSMFSEFKSVNYITVGFLATFGRNEKQRTILAKIDNIIEKLIPKRKKYILIGIARK